MQEHLASLRGRTAAVVVWGVKSTHRQVMVTDGTYKAMRVEAVAALAGAGLRLPSAWSDIASMRRGAGRTVRRPVVVALASGPALSAALQPLVDAGIRVRTVMTPAMALGSLARLRRAAPASGTTEAYVALEEEASCIILVRDGALIASRDLAWGFLAQGPGGRELRRREEVASRLADELREFLGDAGGTTSDVAHVWVCGGLPELRSMTVQLVEHLDIEVEPLDSLFGIDEAPPSATTVEFRERGAELRLAWAAAANRPHAHNLLRARRRAASHAILSRAAVLAGMAVGLGLGATVSASAWWQAAAPLLIARAESTRTGGAADAHRRRADASADPRQSGVRPAARAAEAPALMMAARPPMPPPPPVALFAAREPEPDVDPATAGAAAVRPTPQSSLSASAFRAVQTAEPRPARAAGRARVGVGRAVRRNAGLDSAAPDRRLAIIDGRIVGAGDEVHGARVVEIAPGVVLLRDAHGHLRRLELGARGR